MTISRLIEQSNIPASLIRAVVRQIGGWQSFTESAQDITNHGIDGGFSGFIYTQDTWNFAKSNREAIAQMASNQANDFGMGVMEMIRGFGCFRSGTKPTDEEIGRALPVGCCVTRHPSGSAMRIMKICPKCQEKYEGKQGYCQPCYKAYQLACYAWRLLTRQPARGSRPPNKSSVHVKYRTAYDASPAAFAPVLVKQWARHQANYAIKKGRIKREPCQQCGNPKAEKHHPDYSKPLDVVWLCRRCHYHYENFGSGKILNVSVG